MTKRRNQRNAPLARYRRNGGGPELAAVPAFLAPRETPPTDELGDTGQISWGGVGRGPNNRIISDTGIDYAAAWQLPDNRWKTCQKMQADPQVQASLSALTMPVLAAALKVDPASDSAEDVWLAEFVERGLNNMTTALSRHRMEALGCVGEGVRLFETEYEQREDGYWYPRKLALRPNKTIAWWHADDTGGPDGVTQSTVTGQQVRLYMDRLLAFTHMGDGPSLLGRPAMRAMYRPWLILDGLHRTGSIALERHGVGVPWARYTGSSNTEQGRVDAALMDMHANERLFFRMGADVPDWGIKGVEGTVMDPVPFMEYQRRDLFLASLAQFLALGSDGVGSLALSNDHSGFFMLAIKFIAAEMEDTYNRHLIPRWLGFNWTLPADRLPKVKHALLDQRSIVEWGQAVASLVAAGVPFPMNELARESGRLLGVTVPEAAPEEQGAVEPAIMTGIQISSALDIVARFANNELDYGQALTALQTFLGLDKDVASSLLGKALAGQVSAPSDTGPQDVNDPNAPTAGQNPTAGGPDATALAARKTWPGVTLAANDKRLASVIKMEALGITPDFVAMAANLDKGRDRIIARVGALQAKQARRLTAIGVKLIKAGDAMAVADAMTGVRVDLAAPARPRRLVSYEDEAGIFEDEMGDLYDEGEGDAWDEISQQGASPSRPDEDNRSRRKALLLALALIAGSKLSERMTNAWAQEVTGQIVAGGSGVAGVADSAALLAAMTGLSDKLLTSLASGAVNTALAQGRAAIIEANADILSGELRSAVMDKNTCDYCAGRDGEQAPVGELPSCPDFSCEGQDLCRCENIPIVLGADGEATITGGRGMGGGE